MIRRIRLWWFKIMLEVAREDIDEIELEYKKRYVRHEVYKRRLERAKKSVRKYELKVNKYQL